MGYTPPPPGGPPPLPQPVVHYHQQVPSPYSNGFAITALVLGLCTFVTFGATGIPAVIFGALALNQVKEGTSNQKGMAVAGLVLGIIACVGWIAYWLLFLVASIVGA